MQFSQAKKVPIGTTQHPSAITTTLSPEGHGRVLEPNTTKVKMTPWHKSPVFSRATYTRKTTICKPTDNLDGLIHRKTKPTQTLGKPTTLPLKGGNASHDPAVSIKQNMTM